MIKHEMNSQSFSFAQVTDATDERPKADRTSDPALEFGYSFNRVMSPGPPKLETLLEVSDDD